MPTIKLVTFGPIIRGDWVIKVSNVLDQILVVAYHRTNYEAHVRYFTDEAEAVLFAEYLLLK
jgi:hypothetical protein